MSVLMKRNNGERLVPDEKVAEFLEMGYSVINASGGVIVDAKPSTIPQYKTLVEKLRKENEALKLENAELRKEIEAASKAAEQQGEKGKKSKDK